VDNRPVFDVGAEEDSPLLWAFRLANWLHVDTHPRFVRRELVVRQGDCFDPERVQESARLLRQYRFISTVEVTTREEAPGRHRVSFRTRDEWTTKTRLDASVEGGLRIQGISFSEENLAGRGMMVGVFLDEREERRDYGVLVETPQTLGTRMGLSVRVGKTRVGDFMDQSLVYPFQGEVGRVAFRQRHLRADVLFPYSLDGWEGRGNQGPRRQVVVPALEEFTELTGAVRLGTPGNLTTLGVGVSRERLEFPGFPESALLVEEGDYDNSAPAPDSVVGPLLRQDQPRTSTRANFLLGQRNVNFVQRRGLDAITGIQDIPVGVDLGVMLARSVGILRAGGPASPDDLFVRVRLFTGGAGENWVAHSTVRLEGRQVYGGGPGGRGWRDVLGESHQLFYWSPPRAPGHTLAVRLSGSGGWTVDTPFQLTLGGASGVRGYREDRYPGGHRVVASLEDRIRLPWTVGGLVDLGATLFGDVGFMLPGDVPFGLRSGARGTFGTGLRVGFPAGTPRVIRLDFAFPADGQGLGDLVIRASLGEVAGLGGRIRNEQMERSRKAGIPLEFRGVAR